MAGKAYEEVQNIPSEPLLELPTVSKQMTEKKNRKEDLDKATLSEMSEAIELPRPVLRPRRIGVSLRELEERWRDKEKPRLKKSLTSDINIPILKRSKTSAKENPRLEIYLKSEFEKRNIEFEKRNIERRIKLSRVLKNRVEVLKKREGELKKREEELEKRERDFKGDMDGKTHKGMTEALEMPEADSDINIPKLKRSKSSDIENPSLKRNLTSGNLELRYNAEDAVEIYKSRDDDVLLDPFLCSRSLEEIRKLIESGKLPSQKILDEMCQIYERKSQEITITCEKICEHIKLKHDDIAYVWAAYTIQNPHKITFVVIVKHKSEGDTSTEPLGLEKLITYSFVNQYVGEFSSEGPDVLRQQTSASEGLDEESYQKLQSCISKHSEVLMKKHKFLSIISACSNRSKGFGASWELLPEKCIVLYVQKKNYIPIDEDPFKKYYDGIAVDVREGAFIPFVRTCKERLDPVMMGCEIGGDSHNSQYVRGTLGCFIDHPQFGVCGLTCGHVLLSPNELRELKTTYRGSLKWPLHDMYKNVYQPADQNSSPIGHTVQFICESGSGTKSGMELALFKITDRRPKSADFPEATIISASSVNNIKYDSWRICRTDRLNKKNQVMKFGSKTEFRNGTLMFDNTAVKYLDNYPLSFGDEVLKLFKQIEVKQNDRAFADLGDSGALVFLAENNCCIGIVEGGTTYGTVVVTPIVPILEELKVHCLKSFESETNLSHIDNQIQSMHGDMQKMKCDLQSVRQDIKNIDTNLQIIAQSLSKNQQ